MIVFKVLHCQMHSLLNLFSLVHIWMYLFMWVLAERKSSGVTHKIDLHKSEEPSKDSNRKLSFQSSKVTYGGIDGAYYTSTRTRRMGTDGVYVATWDFLLVLIVSRSKITLISYIYYNWIRWWLRKARKLTRQQARQHIESLEGSMIRFATIYDRSKNAFLQ